jgi:hypothetical protein
MDLVNNKVPATIRLTVTIRFTVRSVRSLT